MRSSLLRGPLRSVTLREATPVLCVVLGLLTGCPAPTEDPVGPDGKGGSPGTGGASSGGSSGSGGVTGTGGAATGGTPGTGGSATGGTPGTGGSVDAGADVPVGGTGGAGGAPASTDAGSDTAGSDEFGDISLPEKPWIRLCAKDATQAQCCDFLCRCLNKHCADSPADKANIANCSNLCMKYNNMAMRCHVYHCFESLNPKVPKDHVSHCGHASNRVPGGGCPAPVYQ